MSCNDYNYINPYDPNLIPDAPSELNINLELSNSVKLTWKDNCQFEIGFEIERKIAANNWQILTSLPENSIDYVDDGFRQGESHFYRVRAMTYASFSNYSNEVSINIIPEKDLVAYYPFVDNANDLSGNGNHGTVSGATLTTDRNGNSNSAYYFDGLEDFIIVADSEELRISTAGTFSVWIYVDVSTNYVVYDYRTILCKGAQYGVHYEDYSVALSNPDYSYNNATGALQWTAAYSSAVNTGVQVPQGTWHHVAVTFDYDNQEIKLYQDGTLFTTYTTSFIPTVVSTRNLYIGARYEDPIKGDFKGKIDDIRIYKRVINEQEILALFYEGGE
jgi:hypothetical protein